ncbi:hypothetical protein JKP88DRAFT_180191, partial [Tribonema minus]
MAATYGYRQHDHHRLEEQQQYDYQQQPQTRRSSEAQQTKIVGNGAKRWNTGEIVSFFNDLLQLDSADAASEPLANIKESSSGCYALQVLDAMYPGCFRLKDCVWGKRDEVLPYEIANNYRILLGGLQKAGVPHSIDMEGVTAGRASCVLEFNQWL